MTEMVTTRGQGCDRSLVRSRDFRSRHKIFVSQLDFKGLCRDKVFYVVIKFWPRPKGLLSPQNICMSRRSFPGQEFSIAT